MNTFLACKYIVARFLTVTAVLLWLLLICGCDTVFDVRMNIYEREQAGWQVKKSREIESTQGSPIEGVHVKLRWEHDDWWVSRVSSTKGAIQRQLTLGGFPWDLGDMKRTKMHFKCRKEGYMPVEGSFTIGEFWKSYSQHGKTVLVFMQPTPE